MQKFTIKRKNKKTTIFVRLRVVLAFDLLIQLSSRTIGLCNLISIASLFKNIEEKTPFFQRKETYIELIA